MSILLFPLLIHDEPSFVNEFITQDTSINGTKPKPCEYAADVNIRRNIDREVVRKGNFEFSRKNVSSHASDLWANAIEC